MTEKILEAIERYDKIMRPKVVILNPETKDLILKEHPEIEKDFVLMADACVEKDKAFVVNRAELEMNYPHIEPKMPWEEKTDAT